jgi:hypothetical protein
MNLVRFVCTCSVLAWMEIISTCVKTTSIANVLAKTGLVHFVCTCSVLSWIEIRSSVKTISIANVLASMNYTFFSSRNKSTIYHPTIVRLLLTTQV